jgi:hypothetical protein
MVSVTHHMPNRLHLQRLTSVLLPEQVDALARCVSLEHVYVDVAEGFGWKYRAEDR